MGIRLVTGTGLVIAAALGAAWAPAAAASEGQGLGASWPNAPDVSRSAMVHAYRWDTAGVKYVQINDQSGRPLMAFASAGGEIIVLPIGHSELVQVASSGSGVQSVLYDDGQQSIGLTSAGTFVVANDEAEPCTDPVSCGKADGIRKMLAMPPPAPTANDTCTDPVSCGK